MASIEPVDHPSRARRAQLALDGLSVGDAFGADGRASADRRDLPRGPWRYTHHTVGATAALEVLLRRRDLDQDALAWTLGRRFRDEPYRGWGARVQRVLDALARGLAWQVVAPVVFDGGSAGSGASVRATVVGAWYADDLEEAAARAQRAAEVTHAAPDAQAGAAAVAAAAAMACRLARRSSRLAGPRLLDTARALTPDGAVRAALERACAIRLDRPVAFAAQALGDGRTRLAADTVPLALWCAARHLDGFPEAMWTAVGTRGDLAAIGAIAGGIVALAQEGVPVTWVERRERLTLARSAGRTRTDGEAEAQVG